MIDLDEKVEHRRRLAHQPGGKLLLASKAGYGFIVPEDELLASKRGGKQVLNGELLAVAARRPATTSRPSATTARR